MRVLPLAAAMALLLASAVRAEVVDAQPNGFEVRQAVHIGAPPAKVYDALAQIGRWWDSAHTYSDDARRLSLEPKAGGCQCETLANGGSVEHMRVINALPGRVLRLEGALGPLQGLGVSGHLTWALAAKDGGADLVETYDVGGYAKGGLAGLAAPVDEVLGQQVMRLKRWMETGTP
jgi:uncharacterized protein YndB with AHSA1/START domain